MRKLRVLIIGGSIVARQRLAEAMAADPALELLGVAAGARLGLAKFEQTRPDLVVLGRKMAKGDHIGILERIKQTDPGVPVIGFGEDPGLWYEGPRILASNSNADPDADTTFGPVEGLIASIKRQGRLAVLKPSPAASRRLPVTSEKMEILVIGASTGGPDALVLLLSTLPADFPTPILIVQHLPPSFTKYLVDRLANQTLLGVHEAAHGDRLLPGRAWLAPGGVHLTVLRDTQGAYVHLSEDPPEQSCRPSVDVLFRSAAATFGTGALAVVLTGMGRDGLAGCAAIRAAGGHVLVQDESTSVVWGMPGQVARAGLADLVLPLHSLGSEIDRRSRERLPIRHALEGEAEEVPCH